MMNTIFIMVQFFFTVVIGIYFLGQLINQRADTDGIKEDSKRECERLNAMRKISLNEPLTEMTRPSTLDEIVGQEDGVKALKIALCGENPQHILLYGPPGVGKTAASRVVMEYAKKSQGTPFKKDAKFIEVDATIMQYDERSIADPLIGSVHDPIYQGAGSYGNQGVPQPKEGAVSKAHGGILFIDEIGELQPIQINRLLKVLEDRKVKFESTYYSSRNKNIPSYIHDIFKNGIPADFRLIGATTKSPEEIPPAIRSRCCEIFFDALKREDILLIMNNAIKKLDIIVDAECCDLMCKYCTSGREVVSIVQTLASKLKLEKRNQAEIKDIEWIIETGRYNPIYSCVLDEGESIGKVNGLAVVGNGSGIVMPIEALCERVEKGMGTVKCGGITENETIKKGNQSFTRISTAKTSVENVRTVLKSVCGLNIDEYDIHLNIPGGIPVDGPSAGVAIFMCCYSAVFNCPVSSKITFTGELGIKGEIQPVGGIREKIEAAISAGADTVVLPKKNYTENLKKYNIGIVPVENIREVIKIIERKKENNNDKYVELNGELATAKSVEI